ncbi:hypothetical protein JK220_15675 [Gluconobacter cerinus]|nr:hypothetical protein [Gluconobacter cerinus]MBS0984562.1 hypothetical protein [Gluconobacter cerinus]
MHTAEQHRSDILTRRQEWFDAQPDLDPEWLVFIEETWASTNMTRRYGRCRRSQSVLVPDLLPGRHRRHGQSRLAQGTGRAEGDRSC